MGILKPYPIADKQVIDKTVSEDKVYNLSKYFKKDLIIKQIVIDFILIFEEFNKLKKQLFVFLK
jgi:hypothetical protein